MPIHAEHADADAAAICFHHAIEFDYFHTLITPRRALKRWLRCLLSALFYSCLLPAAALPRCL